MINHELRCLYVHIPKTAGNSVNAAFGMEWQDHKDLQRYAAELHPETLRDYFKFAIVRNPWERLFSDYNYQRKKSRARSSKLFLYTESGERRRFRDWVDMVMDDPCGYDPSRWGGEVSPGMHRWSPQVDWISIDGQIAVDQVARMENLREDFDRICRALGRPTLRLPWRNRRKHCHYSWYYDDHTRQRVGAYYARDIEAFGYRFESSPQRKAWLLAEARAAGFLCWALRPPKASPLWSWAE